MIEAGPKVVPGPSRLRPPNVQPVPLSLMGFRGGVMLRREGRATGVVRAQRFMMHDTGEIT